PVMPHHLSCQKYLSQAPLLPPDSLNRAVNGYRQGPNKRLNQHGIDEVVFRQLLCMRLMFANSTIREHVQVSGP
ncbi:hypothetical protein FHS27_006516, partial [Rhodopirellula rubra]